MNRRQIIEPPPLPPGLPAPDRGREAGWAGLYWVHEWDLAGGVKAFLVVDRTRPDNPARRCVEMDGRLYDVDDDLWLGYFRVAGRLATPDAGGREGKP